jgi:hypothetical protein
MNSLTTPLTVRRVMISRPHLAQIRTSSSFLVQRANGREAVGSAAGNKGSCFTRAVFHGEAGCQA